MQIQSKSCKTLKLTALLPSPQNPNLRRTPFRSSISFGEPKRPYPRLRGSQYGPKFLRVVNSSRELIIERETEGDAVSIPQGSEEINEMEEQEKEGLESESMWGQIKEIVVFTGPAVGMWVCGPLMSLIDTAVIGQGSSLELAALGPGTVLCDNLCYTFMFLSVATSNLVATSLARQDKEEVQHQISVLLFIGLACGFFMFLFTRQFGSWALTAFAGAKNLDLLPAANTYVQIRGFAWPAVLIGTVAQSASLGMKDSRGPLKALAVAAAINGVGDVVLCRFLGCGIAGAAWATMVSQVVAAYMMMDALNKKGYNAFSLTVPSPSELLTILGLAAPVFVTMTSKIAFYTLLVYFATSMGTNVLAAHQVMIQAYCMCSVWGEPLSQTAQSFMPELLYGVNRNLPKARMLLKSLASIGATVGLVVGTLGTAFLWLFPGIFTPDKVVVKEMHKVLISQFLALAVTPIAMSFEGTLLAGRDLRYMSISMSGCFVSAGLLLMLLSNRGYGLQGCWFTLVGFLWARFFLSLGRLLSRDGVLYVSDAPSIA
ncbi:PREDICTED: protein DETOXIFICATION 46, chloroplastic-like [Tarenaya hassleriana]|uniref:protein DETOXIFICATION 46, chloroplastic-like n=1 Tax=Tarenaya hassleriana TaxID=28532 RepID=UPI00053C11B1|nr:PREDICTED: protein DETOXIFICATION 46, chloroplastic-like [Tarenaya hassleriana]